VSTLIGEVFQPCCIFTYSDATTAVKNFNMMVVKDLGDRVLNADTTLKHYTYMWDRGGRKIVCCKTCGAIFLYQWAEVDMQNLDFEDMEYQDYFQVNSIVEALRLNQEFKPYDLETNFKGLRIWNSEDGWHWNKN